LFGLRRSRTFPQVRAVIAAPTAQRALGTVHLLLCASCLG
jgi:hypothetical protein